MKKNAWMRVQVDILAGEQWTAPTRALSYSYSYGLGCCRAWGRPRSRRRAVWGRRKRSRAMMPHYAQQAAQVSDEMQMILRISKLEIVICWKVWVGATARR
eukprot:scaffold393529_cov45-Prasinocladus_malaysianus.AAC.1